MTDRNVLDRAVAWVSPEAGLRRDVARARSDLLQAGDRRPVEARASATTEQQTSETRWRGASRVLRSMKSWLPRLGSAYSNLPPPERKVLIARSHDAYRNTTMARAVVTRNRTNVVGTGLMPHATVDAAALGISPDEAEELNRMIDSEWSTWADDPTECDLEATLDFTGQQSLALLSAMLTGDCFANSPFVQHPGRTWGLKVQLIDGLRVDNSNNAPDSATLVQGVEMDANGFPIAVHIRRRHPADPLDPTGAQQWDRYEVFGRVSGHRRVMQVWNDKDQIGMVRGAPFLAPILEPLQQLEQYDRAELFAAVSQALITFFLQQKDGVALDSDFAELPTFATDADEESAPAEAQRGTPQVDIGSGAVVELEPGVEAKMEQPTRPNAQFDPFFMSVVKRIGAALEMPVDELLLHYQSSYSAARAAMLQAWRFYTMRRWWLVQQFCIPFRQLWFDEAVARGRIPVTNYADPRRRAAYAKAMWIGPARGSMDEYKEAQAAEKRIQIGISNETIETAAMMGEPWRDVHDTRVRERRIAQRDSVRRNRNGNAQPDPGQQPADQPEPTPAAPEEGA
jgi:lambda family phage portal protein